MIMEKQVQMIGGLKRDVVAGQFEDPDDEVVPKRMRTTPTKADDVVKVAVLEQSPIPPPIAPLASLPIPLSAAPATAATAQPQLPVPIIPHPAIISSSMMPMSVSLLPVPMIPHPMHPAAAAAWQHQHQAFVMSHMFAMMNPMMHHIQQQFLQRTMTAEFPPTVDPRRIQHKQESRKHPIQTASDSETDEEWRIPYSHNFHPKTGFIQDQGATNVTAASTTGTACKPANGRTCSKGAQVIMTPLDDSFLKEFDFPRIKEDTEKRFGLKAYEINSMDVLCGRGGVTNSHEGNVQFRNLADQYRWHYATVKKCRKAHVARFLVQKIRDQHGRFLKKEDDDSWYEIGDELALAKAAQTLREGLAKIYRDGLKAKMEIDRTSGPPTEVQANAELFSPTEDENKTST